MVRMGLTGGIASGKSLVADELEALGARVIDADVLARQVVEPGSPGLTEIVTRFGEAVLLPNGTLDRSRLGDMVFGDRDALDQLNAIIHPRVRAAARRLEESSRDEDVVVHVIPLLVETGQQDSYDTVVVVDVPEEVQVQRLMQRNALSERQALDRLHSQVSRARRLAAADWIIDNSGAPEDTRALVHKLWDGPLTALRAEITRR